MIERFFVLRPLKLEPKPSSPVQADEQGDKEPEVVPEPTPEPELPPLEDLKELSFQKADRNTSLHVETSTFKLKSVNVVFDSSAAESSVDLHSRAVKRLSTGLFRSKLFVSSPEPGYGNSRQGRDMTKMDRAAPERSLRRSRFVDHNSSYASLDLCPRPKGLPDDILSCHYSFPEVQRGLAGKKLPRIRSWRKTGNPRSASAQGMTETSWQSSTRDLSFVVSQSSPNNREDSKHSRFRAPSAERDRSIASPAPSSQASEHRRNPHLLADRQLSPGSSKRSLLASSARGFPGLERAPSRLVGGGESQEHILAAARAAEAEPYLHYLQRLNADPSDPSRLAATAAVSAAPAAGEARDGGTP